MDNYEQLLGTIHPGYFKPLSPDLQKCLREIQRLRESSRAWVMLSISHPTLHHEYISAALNLEPDNVSSKGDTVYEDDRHHIKANWTRWTISSKGKVSRKERLEKHINWLLDQLSGRLPAIRSLQNDGAEFTLTAFMKPWSRLVDPRLEVGMMQQLWQFRIPLEFVIHYQNTNADY